MNGDFNGYIVKKIKDLMPDENHVPQGVLYSRLKNAVQKDLSESLNSLLEEKRLSYSRTLNDILIKPIKYDGFK